MTTRLYSHPVFMDHRTPTGHPERPERMRAVADALAVDAFSRLERRDAPAGDLSVYARVHPENFVEAIITAGEEIAGRGETDPDVIAHIDGDTAISPKSLDAMKHLAGASVDAVNAVFAGEADNAFIAARPPGHHAEKTTAMGFCLFNTIAAAARHAQAVHGVERVAIVDFDVHHGNGTQDIFWDDKSVLFCSCHQMPLFPGTGAENQKGEHGTIVNTPLRAGDEGSVLRAVFRDRFLPALDDFQPDFLLISAGFDAHHRDPLGGLGFTADDFDWATGQLLEVAGRYCENRLVSLLEGGYDLKGLADSASAHVSRLMTG